MQTITASRRARQGNARQAPATAPASLRTTLYEVMSVLQNEVAPHEDALIVDIVARWLRSGRLTLTQGATAAA